MLNFIKWNLSKCSSSIKSRAYFSLVRPSLEYASLVWNPHYNTHILSIEKVQRRAIRWTLNDYNYCSSVSAIIIMLQDLNWPTLQYRHQRARLSLLQKSLHNLKYHPTISQTTTRLDYITNYHIFIPVPVPTAICIVFSEDN